MSETSSHPRKTLRSQLPGAGLRWPDRATLLPRERQNFWVLNALRDRGGVSSLRADAHGNARHEVENAFVTMFETSRAATGRIDSFDNALDWVADLRGRLSWGDFIEEDLFINLFLRIGRARKA